MQNLKYVVEIEVDVRSADVGNGSGRIIRVRIDH